MNRPYKSPELPPPDDLARSTARYAEHNAALRAKQAKASDRHILRTSAGLDEATEAARCELLTQCQIGKRYDQEGADPQKRLAFYASLRDACEEFFAALGASTPRTRSNHLDAMHEAIASLDRYRGAGR